MKRIRYSKYVPDPAGEMSMEDLLSALSDYLLQSGFNNYIFDDMSEGNGEQTLDDLRRAIEQALLEGDLLDEEMREQLHQMQMDGTLDELIEQLIERMAAGRLHQRGRAARSPATIERWRANRRGPASEIRDHRQEPGFSRIQDPARPDGIAGQIQFRTP